MPKSSSHTSCQFCSNPLYGQVNFCPFCGNQFKPGPTSESVRTLQNTIQVLNENDTSPSVEISNGLQRYSPEYYSIIESPSLATGIPTPIPKDLTLTREVDDLETVTATEANEAVQKMASHTVRSSSQKWKLILGAIATLVIAFFCYQSIISMSNEEKRHLAEQLEKQNQEQAKIQADRTRIELEKKAAQEKKSLAAQQKKLRQDKLKLAVERQSVESEKLSEAERVKLMQEQEMTKREQAKIDIERQQLDLERKAVDERAKISMNNQGSNIKPPQLSMNSGGLFRINYRSEAMPYIELMIIYARDKDKTMSAMSRIDALNKPMKGNKSRARKLNDEALILTNQAKYSAAIPLLQDAHNTDPSDVEVVNNLAGAVLNASFDTYDFSRAKELFIDTLLLKPNRSIAWANLGYLFSMEGNESAATNCYINFFRFAVKQQNALKYLDNGRSHPNPVVSKAFLGAYNYVLANMSSP